MVHFRKRFSDEDLRRINELVVQRGKEIRIRSGAVTQPRSIHRP
jgi:IS5 family transposase